MPEQDAPTPLSDPAQPHTEAVAPATHEPAGQPDSADPTAVDPSTRLVLARLASGTSRLLEQPSSARATGGTLTSARTRAADFGSMFFPSVGGPGGRGIGRLE
ncbi:MAG: hypothetical protein Q7T55_12710, partial [Solirubrobacteraceae bacterium]|nr:hypothetical protein [Solirubrobacteraceae bacterium]